MARAAAARRPRRAQLLWRPGGRRGGSSAIHPGARSGRRWVQAVGPPGMCGGPLWTRPGARNVPGEVPSPHSPLDPPGGQAGPPGVAGGCPAPPTRPSRNQGPSQRRRGPHRGSTSRSSPGGSLSWSAWQFLEPHLHLRRLSVHGCSRRVALQVAFGAPPPQRPRAHWPIAPCPRSLARSTPAFIGPRCLRAGTT